ncbi:MAG: NUDIX hydrolase [Kofleriaceae bacterium]|jgi:8-oxo-dGTP diphosphatase|nr:NUDIX hydrolase [Kofleriaceae bacterium]MBP6836825.1 NUDIX hydrolase [Kofleriaceae bacterium]MBP9206538.1 NUDIX hydrolase [Kofleriaceae bacterium]
MSGGHRYEYPRAALTVDCVVFGLDQTDLKVLLIQRKLEPFRHAWALPGGFVHVDETLDQAARRELAEEAGVTDVYLEQLYTFGELTRDPRERVVTVAYYALAKLSDHKLRAATDAVGVGWFPLVELPTLAFDHADIVDRARDRLRGKVRYSPIGFELLPPRFSLTQLQRLYEIVLGGDLDKRNFRKKILSMDLLVETDEVEQGVRHRAARLYRFDRRKYDKLAKHGFSFAI